MLTFLTQLTLLIGRWRVRLLRRWDKPPCRDKPRFYTNESYQGAQKRIYPYPMQDGVAGIRQEQTYKALYLGQDADFFAKFGEQQTRQVQQASAQYTIGLGCLGTGDVNGALTAFEAASKLNLSHVWARTQAEEAKQTGSAGTAHPTN